jgi:hypothetical protein
LLFAVLALTRESGAKTAKNQPKNQKCRRADIERKALRFGKNRGDTPLFLRI